MTAPRLNLTHDLVYEGWHRLQERIGMMCEDRIPTPAIIQTAEREANEWLSQELAFAEVDRELSF